jgi:hypothetical protein
MKIRPPGREGVEQQAGGCTKGAARSRRAASWRMHKRCSKKTSCSGGCTKGAARRRRAAADAQHVQQEVVEQQAGGCTKGAARSRRTGSKAGLVWFDWFGGLVWLVERKTLLVRFGKKKKNE